MVKWHPAEQAAQASLYFDELLHAQVLKLNPNYAELYLSLRYHNLSTASCNRWRLLRHRLDGTIDGEVNDGSARAEAN